MRHSLVVAISVVLSCCTTATLDESRLPVAQNTFVADTEGCLAMFKARAFDSMKGYEGCNITALKRFAAGISLTEQELVATAERRLLALAAEADAMLASTERRTMALGVDVNAGTPPPDEVKTELLAYFTQYMEREQQIAYDFMSAVYATNEYTKSRNAAIWQAYLDWRATLPNRTNVYIREEQTLIQPTPIALQPVLRCGIGGNCRP